MARTCIFNRTDVIDEASFSQIDRVDNHVHVPLPSGASFKDLSPCQCLYVSVDVFFDALTKVNESSAIKVVNYMAQKLASHLVTKYCQKEYTVAPSSGEGEAGATESTDMSPLMPTPSFGSIQWMNLLRGFTESIDPSDFSPRTLAFLTMVDISEKLQQSLPLNQYDAKTFRIIVKQLRRMQEFPELQDDDLQKQIFDLQQNAYKQETICHYLKGNSEPPRSIEALMKVYPLSVFCNSIKRFMRTINKKLVQAKRAVKTQVAETVCADNQSESMEQEETAANISLDSGVECTPSTSQSIVDPELPESLYNSDKIIVPMNQLEHEFPDNFVDEVDPELPYNSGSESDEDPVTVLTTGVDDDEEPSEPPFHNSQTIATGSEPKAKKKQVLWSEREVEYLKQGVEKYCKDGRVLWKKILEEYPFNQRNQNDLAAKWRNMQIREKKYQKQSKGQMWSEEEVDYLIRGVEKHGVGHWAKILKMYPFKNRSSQHLSRKWIRLQSPPPPAKRKVLRKRSNQQVERSSTPRQQYVKWSAEETKFIEEGVQKFGLNNPWDKILKIYPFKPCRSAKCLSNKWQRMKVQKRSACK